MSDQLRKFLSGLPDRAGYCIDCLTEIWGNARIGTIGGYVNEIGIIGRHGHCGKCGEHKKTFMATRSS